MNKTHTAKQLIMHIKKLNLANLRILSEELLEAFATEKDKQILQLSLLSYALAKVLAKALNAQQAKAIAQLQQDILKPLTQYEKTLESKSLSEALELIDKHDKNFSMYVEEITSKAKIKKASLLYLLGFSLGASCEQCKVTKWDLMSYVGGTKEPEGDTPLAKKISHTNHLFDLV